MKRAMHPDVARPRFARPFNRAQFLHGGSPIATSPWLEGAAVRIERLQ